MKYTKAVLIGCAVVFFLAAVLVACAQPSDMVTSPTKAQIDEPGSVSSELIRMIKFKGYTYGYVYDNGTIFCLAVFGGGVDCIERVK